MTTTDFPASQTASETHPIRAGGEPSTLGQLLRRILAETDLASPDDIADEAFERTSDAQIRDFYRTAVRAYAHLEVTRDRMRTSTTPKLKGKQPFVPSRKVQSIRNAWERQLRERVYVGGDWKLFAECSHANLVELAADRQAVAEKNLAASNRYTAIAKHMKRLKVSTVADLPSEVLENELGAAA